MLTVVTKGYGRDRVYEVVDEKGGIKNPYSFNSFDEANEWKKEKEQSWNISTKQLKPIDQEQLQKLLMKTKLISSSPIWLALRVLLNIPRMLLISGGLLYLKNKKDNSPLFIT